MTESQFPRYPLFLNLEGKKILIVGAGKVAARRAGVLLRFGCEIRVCAPEKDEDLKEIWKNWIQEGKIQYESRRFDRSVLTGEEFLVFAATNEKETNLWITEICRQKGIFVNNASDFTTCDFFFPSIVQEEELIIGITGDGTDHGKVKRLRKKIQDMLKGEKRPK